MERFSLNIIVCTHVCRSRRGVPGELGRVVCDFNHKDIRDNAGAGECANPRGNMFDLFVPKLAEKFDTPTVERTRREAAPPSPETAAAAEALIASRRPICAACPECGGVKLHPRYPYPTDALVTCALAPACCSGKMGGEMSIVHGACARGLWPTINQHSTGAE